MHAQKADGTFGIIVVREYEKDNLHKDRYDFDLSEHVLIFNEWVNDSTIKFFKKLDFIPTSLLINGKGQAKVFENGDNNILKTPRSVFRVQKGFRYRFRLLSANYLNCPLEFSIDNHNLTVIASDGKNLEPVEVSSIIMFPGSFFFLFFFIFMFYFLLKNK